MQQTTIRTLRLSRREWLAGGRSRPGRDGPRGGPGFRGGGGAAARPMARVCGR